MSSDVKSFAKSGRRIRAEMPVSATTFGSRPSLTACLPVSIRERFALVVPIRRAKSLSFKGGFWRVRKARTGWTDSPMPVVTFNVTILSIAGDV